MKEKNGTNIDEYYALHFLLQVKMFDFGHKNNNFFNSFDEKATESIYLQKTKSLDNVIHRYNCQ